MSSLRKNRCIKAMCSLGRDANGQELLRWLLEETGIHRAYLPTDNLAIAGYREGRRSIGEQLLHLMRAAGLPRQDLAYVFKMEGEDNDDDERGHGRDSEDGQQPDDWR